jgi:acetyl-CoA acetyltransferase
VIVGIAEADLVDGRLSPSTNVLGHQAAVGVRALEDAGLSLADVDGLFVAGTWGVPGPGAMPTLAMSEYLGINPRYSGSTNIGGASFEAHIAHAAMAIEFGLCDVALITFGSMQRSDRSRSGVRRVPALSAQYESPYGLLMPVGAYALAAQRYIYQYGATPDDLAGVASASREWAAMNPQALLRDPLTAEQIEESPLVSDPLRKLDCCLVTDGAGAVVMASADRLDSSRRGRAVYLRGYGESQTHFGVSQMPDLTAPPAVQSGRRAMQMAGVSHDDIDVVEIYDSFTITVLLTLEALGFCGAGEAVDLVREKAIAPGGRFPLNTNGGGLSHAHPGMYGAFLAIEAVRQLRGEAGDRQVGDASVALVHGTGGFLSSGATCILTSA